MEIIVENFDGSITVLTPVSAINYSGFINLYRVRIGKKECIQTVSSTRTNRLGLINSFRYRKLLDHLEYLLLMSSSLHINAEV